MELFYSIITWINNIFLVLCTVAFGQQLIYTLLFFLPKKKYKPAKENHKFAIIIPARNECTVITDTVKCLLQQNYPRECFDIFVVADNCTDNTAELARNAGAIVFEHHDDDPKHKKVAYAIAYGIEQILENYDNYEAFIRFDADNFIHPDYIARMNDAYDSGACLAKGYNHAKNLEDNVISGISGLWYIRDCRYSCHARSALHSTQVMVGSGMMFSADIIKDNGGWRCMTASEDAEFTMEQLYHGHKVSYVPDAITYDDQPTTIADTFKRNARMGNGLFKLFFKDGLKSLGKFCTTLRYSYLDMFLNFLFIPIAVVCCVWMPFYYGFDIIYHLCIGSFGHVMEVVQLIGVILVVAYLLPFILQAILVLYLERDRVKFKDKGLMVKVILCFPLFMIIYALGITFGVLSRPKWKAINRSSTSLDDFISSNTSNPEPSEPKAS